MDAQTALCQGELVDAIGGVWHMSPPTYTMQGQFEGWMKLQARLELAAQRPFLPPALYAAESTNLNAAFVSGDFSWGGTAFASIVASHKGSLHLILLMLKANHPDDVNAKIVEEIHANATEQLGWAYRSCLAQADPSHFSPPEVARPAGVKPATDLAATNGIPATAGTSTTPLPASA